MSKDVIQRIVNRDMKEIKKMELSKLGIHIHFNEEDIMKAIAMIIGPKDTPYENGVLYFVIDFPKDYPFNPPKIGYYSRSRYRIHPNLYVGKTHDNYIGKVCLSSINTWSGPKWTTVMHIGSILLSIQSLLCNNPLHNEPGFENEVGERNDLYNQIVEYDTYENLILYNCFDIPEVFNVFTPIIKNDINFNKENIIKKLNRLSKKNPKPIKIALNIYNLLVQINYPLLEARIMYNLTLNV